MAEEVKQELGIDETMQALVAVNEIALAIIPLMKDGIQAADALALYEKFKTDPAFKEKIEAGYKDINKVSAEAKDINLKEGLELVIVQASYLPKIIAALKAEPKVAG